MFGPAIKSMRPHQWVKNVFVAAPLVFAERVGDAEASLRTLAAFAIFCLLSSAVYLVNDLVDVEKDRAHPTKRRRPIASGALPVRAARGLAIALAAVALGGALVLGPGLALAVTAASYLVLNLAYSLALKKVPFVDVACISLGFLLRVVAGAVAIPVEASHWVLLCTLMLSSLLGFGKRAHELRVAGETGRAQRDVLHRYDPKTLRILMVVLGILTTVAYILYTRSLVRTERLLWTVPFVGFGVFRFIWLAGSKTDAESPTDSMMRDAPFVANLVLYAAAVLGILYTSI
jgi:4-hydroxybenzoate polyprenyltransferase